MLVAFLPMPPSLAPCSCYCCRPSPRFDAWAALAEADILSPTVADLLRRWGNSVEAACALFATVFSLMGFDASREPSGPCARARGEPPQHLAQPSRVGGLASGVSADSKSRLAYLSARRSMTRVSNFAFGRQSTVPANHGLHIRQLNLFLLLWTWTYTS